MKIILDAMGGDHAPAEPVAGAVQAAREFDVEVVLVGQKPAIAAELAKHDTSGLRLPIVEAADVIPMDEHHPSDVWRRMKGSSLVVALNLLRDGGGDALVSAGNTGAVVASSLFILKRVEGIERPCLATIFPTRDSGRPILLADAGATPDAKPHYLVQWARMSAVYMKTVFGQERPRIALLSNGEEESKGNALVQDAFPLLEASGLNFIGNIEGKDIPSSAADVVITDGFTGNVVIKLAEGLGSMILELLREELTANWTSKLLAAGLRPAFRRVRGRMDYAEYGGAPLFGVAGLVIKAHGRSNAHAIRSAIRVAHQAAQGGTLAAFQQIGATSSSTTVPASGGTV
ncbi:MAG TPA: phosphate acyltransferase PlsX, partial [Chloroflexia bacterium]|nr:phosphate acyltransferase PlsX [Chloroflexia bacterium]